MYRSDSSFRLLADARAASLRAQPAPRRNPADGPKPAHPRRNTRAGWRVRLGLARPAASASLAAEAITARGVTDVADASRR